MNIPAGYQYTASHEWVEELANGNWRLGLTDYAQQALGGLVFVNLPEPGDSVAVGQSFGDVESVKAVSEVYSPVDGEVAAVNELLLDQPQAINEDPYGAWLIEVKINGSPAELLSPAQYAQLIATEE
jgi:glycine cleavage system H protein